MTSPRFTTANTAAIAATFVFALVAALVGFYFLFDSIGVAIAPAIVFAAAFAFGVYLITNRKRI